MRHGPTDTTNFIHSPDRGAGAAGFRQPDRGRRTGVVPVERHGAVRGDVQA